MAPDSRRSTKSVSVHMMFCGLRSGQCTKQNGMALALLLWFLAALSLMVGGLMLVAKSDITYTNLQKNKAELAALGDAAAYSLLAGVNARQLGRLHYEVQFSGKSIAVTTVPAVGLVSLYHADENLLSELFFEYGGLDSSQAMAIAESVVEWRELRKGRESRNSRGAVGHNAIEDLMSVDGVTRELFERVKPWIHAESAGGSVSPEWAPEQVLRLLNIGGVETSQRESNGDDVASTLYKGTMRISSSVTDGGGKVYTRNVWVRPSGDTLLGWVILRREPVIVTTVNRQ